MSRYLIAIGSPDCPGMGLRSLAKVPSDVDRVARFFTSPEQGYTRVLETEIPIGGPARRIKDQLESWFSSPDRAEEDCVVLYYAGHGDLYGTFKRHYLFTSDSDPRRLVNTALETADLPKLV